MAAGELLAGAGAALLFALLAYIVVLDLSTSLDQALFGWLRGPATPWLDTLAHGLSLLGSEVLGLIHLLLLAVLLRRRHFALAAGLFVSTAGAGLLNGWIKDLFDRPRPAEVYGLLPASGGQLFSFPSGHAMVSAAFLFFLAYVAWPALAREHRIAVASGLATMLVVVGLARTYLGAHYLTDVLAGYLIGFVWADLVILAGYLLGCRWRQCFSGKQ